MIARKFSFLALFAFSGVASAQSTVTLYGIVDLGYQQIKAGNSISPGVSGQNLSRLDGNQYTLAGNRWGLRFNEDLGSGLFAGGVLEAGYLPDTGQSATTSSFFNRQVYLSIGAKSWGEFRLGRQYRLQDETVVLNSPFNNGMILGANFGYRTSGPLASPGSCMPMFVDNARVDNAVQYISPTFSGFRVQAMIAAGEGVTPRYQGLRGSYILGPVALAAAYETDGPSSTQKAKLLTIGAAYNFDVVKVVGGYQRGRHLNANFVGAPTNPAALSDSIVNYQDTSSYTIGVRKDIGAFGLGVNYSKTEFENASGQSRSLGRVAVGGTYSLSKLTRLYAAYGQATGDLKERIIEKRLIEFGINKAF
jgi:predicted porin